MFRPLCLFFTILFLGLSFVVSAQDNVIALDTFDDDTVGQPPGTPEIGTSNHWGIPGHTIIDDYGSPRLRIVDIDSGGGTGSTWYPTALPLVSEVSFTFRMEAYAGDYPVAHAFVVETGSGTGSTAIIWRDDGWIQWEYSLVGHWSADRDYDIRMRIDCIHDTAEIFFDVLWWSIKPLECDHLTAFAASAFYSTSSNATFSIDDIMIVDFLVLFYDGFEDGDTLQWSATVPPP